MSMQLVFFGKIFMAAPCEAQGTCLWNFPYYGRGLGASWESQCGELANRALRQRLQEIFQLYSLND